MDCKPIGTLLDVKILLEKLSEEECNKHLHKMKGITYQKTVGLLTHAIVATKLDLVFEVSVIIQSILKPSLMHWMAGKRII